MSPELYQIIEQIINVSCMTNKWMMWSEKNLPEASVYVPSVFQMRDAYCHLITMMSTGIAEQHLEYDKDAALKFDIQQFLVSPNVLKQLSEALSHSLRAFFDTSEYIATRLSEEAEQKADSFLLLRKILADLDETINQLRAEKANSPTKAYVIVENWDHVLQCLTCAYVFSSYEASLNEKYRTLYDLVLSIEQRFDKETIKEFDPDFFTRKASLPELKRLPKKYLDFTKGGPLDILEDPVTWQNSVKEEFSNSIKKLETLYDQCAQLMETMPSTALIRKGSIFSLGGSGLIKSLILSLISLILTEVVNRYLFIDPSSPEVTLFNRELFMQLLIIFAVLYILLFIAHACLKKLILWCAKRL